MHVETDARRLAGDRHPAHLMGINPGAIELAAADQGVTRIIVDTMRLGIHIGAALWIAAASWRATDVVWPVGLARAVILGGYSLVAPWVPIGVYFAALMDRELTAGQ